MKKLLFILMGVLMSLPGVADTFEYTYEGQTLTYYSFASSQGEPLCNVSSASKSISGDLIIPEFVIYNDMEFPVTGIMASVFQNCTELTSIVLPNTITTIQERQFYGCSSLHSVVLGSSISKIKSYAFYNCANLTSIELPNSLKTVGDKAFYSCNLKSLVIPDSVTEIGASAFEYNRELTSLVIGSSVSTIGDWAFSECHSLISVDIPDSVTELGTFAFDYCLKLRSLRIGSSVKSLKTGVFNRCKEIRNLIIADGPETLYVRNDIFREMPLNYLYLGRKIHLTKDGGGQLNPPFYEHPTLTEVKVSVDVDEEMFYNCENLTKVGIEDSVHWISAKAFWSCSSLKNLSLGASVFQIGKQAFESCPISTLEIPSSVGEILAFAFSGTSLTKVTIPNSVTYLGEGAFYSKAKMKELIIEDGDIPLKIQEGNSIIGFAPDSGKLYIGRNLSFTYKSSNDSPFYNQQYLSDVTIGPKVTTLPEGLIVDCKNISSINLVDAEAALTVNKIPFYYCSAKKLYMGRQLSGTQTLASIWTEVAVGPYVNSIRDYEFSNCTNLKSVDFSKADNLTKIGNGAFYNCTNLESFNLPNSIVEIDKDAFNGCSNITSLNIPNSLNKIGESAFNNCSTITSLTFPPSLNNIADKAFALCKNLKDIHIEAGDSPLNLGSYVFSQVNGIEKVYIGRNLVYKQSPFSGMTSINEVCFGDNVTQIEVGLFDNCTGLSSMVLPLMITRIGDRAFRNTKLESLTIPSLLTEIGNLAFQGCASLEEVSIEPGMLPIKFIGTPFQGVNNIEKLNIGRNFEYTLDNSPFASLIYLTDLSIGDLVTKLGDKAFYGCSKLTEVNLPNNLSSIGESAFYGCKQLSSINLPDSLTYIGEYAFAYCDALSEIFIPNGITSIERSTFYHTGLQSIIIPNSVTTIEKEAFSGCIELVSITLPQNLCIIPDNLFYNCKKLRRITIPDSVSEIGSMAFYNCTALNTVVLSSALTYIGSSTFSKCSGMFTLVCPAVIPPSIGMDTFSNYQVQLQVPKGSLEDYKDHAIWGKFATIIPINVYVDSIEITPTELEASIDTIYDLTATVYPEDATNKLLEWSSSDESVAVVDQNGKITTISEGECVITASATDGSDVKGYCALRVLPRDIPVEHIELDPAIWNFSNGDAFTITATVFPEDATNKTLEWSSADEDIAIVDQEGNVMILKPDTTIIRVKATDGSGVEATCLIEVTTSLNDIELNPSEPINIYNLQGILISGNIKPEDLHNLDKGFYIVCQGKNTRLVYLAE